MPNYDTAQYQPPAPVEQITLRNPDTGATWSDVPFLLDTGADVSLVPQASLQQLGLVVALNRQYERVGFDGNRSTAPVVRLELLFCRRTFRGEFLLIDQDQAILGRNILNAVPLLLD